MTEEEFRSQYDTQPEPEPDNLAEARNLLVQAFREITYLEPDASAYKLLKQIMRNQPQPGRGYSPDLGWAIENFLDRTDPDSKSEYPEETTA